MIVFGIVNNHPLTIVMYQNLCLKHNLCKSKKRLNKACKISNTTMLFLTLLLVISKFSNFIAVNMWLLMWVATLILYNL